MPLKTKSAPKEHLGLTTRQKMKKYRAFYIMFIPLFLCLILFSYLPMFGILYAFTDYTPFKPAQFVGLQNFQKLFSQAGFWKAFFNTLQISITKLVIDTLGSIVLALLPLGLAAGACGLVGNWLGTTFFLEKGGRGVKPIMLGVLALFFLRVLGEG